MPLARYFLFVGGVLLLLLYISDACLPKLPVADSANAELPVIRIHSDRKWPEPVAYDTSLLTIIPAQTTNTDASVPTPAKVADIPATARVREARAQLQPSDATQLQGSKPKTPGPKLRSTRKIAKPRTRPSMVLAAPQPKFDFFGNSIR